MSEQSDEEMPLHRNAAIKSLKSRMSAVKESASEYGAQSVRRYENLALLQAQLQHDQIQKAQQEKIDSLKAHLAAVIERTTRIRNTYEKEKKHLTGQVEKLSRERVASEREHAQEFQNLREAHAAKLSSVEGDRVSLQAQLDDALHRLKQCKVDASAQQRKLYERYQQDLREAQAEAAREVARERKCSEVIAGEVRARDAELEKLRAKLETAVCGQRELQVALEDARKEGRASRARQDALQGEISKLESAMSQRQRQFEDDLEELAARADAKLSEYKDQKAAEMEQIHDKLQGVLSKKNLMISQLRSSLESAHVRLAAHETDLRRQKLELLDTMDEWCRRVVVLKTCTTF